LTVPLRVFGRQVGRSAAPGLWQVIGGLAAGQDALMPDHVVVGLHDGFFVTSSDIRLGPDDVRLQGRTLYLSAPELALLDRDEIAAVIAHELAHFSGEDTAYTQRFLPVYAGIDRSLWAIRRGSAAARSGVLLRPAECLGLHVMATFDAAVKHWSRLRELAADQASAVPAGPRAAASALIRTGLIAGVANAVLRNAIQHPEAAHPDLVAAIVQRATATGLGDPGEQLTNTQPQPTDSHPANVQRIEALGVAADDILLTRASRPTHADDTQLRTLFADWPGLCVTLTVDALILASEQDELLETVLQTHAALPPDTPTNIYQATRRAQLIAGIVGGVLLVAFAGLTYALWTFRTEPPSDRPVLLLLVDVGLVAGVALAALLGAGWRRAGRTPFLTMQPDTLACRDLDRPIPWLEIVGITVVAAGMHTFIYLAPDALLPKRIRGWRVRVNARRRSVTILSMAPQGMTVQAYLDVLEAYRIAAYARDALAGRNAAPP
jgi:Zn-dependent protease with chaperone function